MEDPADGPSVSSFFVLLAAIWCAVSGWFWFVYDGRLTIYYSLLYISFLGVVELGSGFGLQLPKRKWLNLAIVAGFVGWVASLFMYFS